ncbi:MAG: TOBE domain-containing protein, partial [Devosia sp.]
DGKVTLVNGVSWTVEPLADHPVDILVGVRPEHFVPGSIAVSLPMTVDIVEYLGGTRYVYATFAGERQITIEDRGASDMQLGGARDFPLDVSKALYFTPEGERLRAKG